MYRMHMLDLMLHLVGCGRSAASALLVPGGSVERMVVRTGKKGSLGWSGVYPALFGALGEAIGEGCCRYRRYGNGVGVTDGDQGHFTMEQTASKREIRRVEAMQGQPVYSKVDSQCPGDSMPRHNAFQLPVHLLL